MKQPERDPNTPFAIAKCVFSPQECEAIRGLGQAAGFSSGTIGKFGADGEQSETVRKSDVAYLPTSLETNWIYERLHKVAFEANQKIFKLHLAGYGEAVQVAHYRGDGSHYSWHYDIGRKQMSLRKLSQVVFLSNPTDYHGGEFEFLNLPAKNFESEQGSCLLFPSYEVHRVKPVTHGERWSLTAWISGPPFI